MVMAPSQAVAGDGVQHRTAQKCQANRYEQNVEHANFSWRSGINELGAEG